MVYILNPNVIGMSGATSYSLMFYIKIPHRRTADTPEANHNKSYIFIVYPSHNSYY